MVKIIISGIKKKLTWHHLRHHHPLPSPSFLVFQTRRKSGIWRLASERERERESYRRKSYRFRKVSTRAEERGEGLGTKGQKEKAAAEDISA